MLDRILCMFGKSRKQPIQDQASAVFSDISAETEVGIIKTLLERKFNRKFQARVKADGYVGGEMEYKLVLDDYCSNGLHKYHSVWGNPTQDVLGVRKAFVEAYWNGVKRGFDALSAPNLDKWDSDRAAELRETAVAGSREEMFLRAAAEGLV